jgi:S-(hydroxymethyl)glutathione dehydrogenase/alcohol dehydrogenase
VQSHGIATSTLPDGTTPLSCDGQPVYRGLNLGALAEYSVVPATGAVKIPKDVPLDVACVIGCAVQTGVGAVFNTARVEPGASVAVFGCGGVGLNVVQGAAIAGAERIIAIDTVQAKLDMAKTFGATDTILAKPGEDTAKALKKMTGGGPDYAFECVGVGALAETAYRAIRRGGKAVVVGVARATDAASIKPMSMVFEEKSLQGSYFGSSVPRIDFPRMLQLYMAGRLKLDELITQRYGIDQAPQAFADLESGRNARGVIVF